MRNSGHILNRLKNIFIGTLLFTACAPLPEEGTEQPNFIFIFADDLGYGDLGCFGATDIATPHIDRIAAEGIKFTSFYSASSICSPSRAGFLTGRYPQRMGITKVFHPESHTGMPASEFTLAEMLKEKGYATGMIGKWHLGHREAFLPLQQGFDYFFGTPYSNDMASFAYIRGNDFVELQVDQSQITNRYTQEAKQFISQHADDPFFLYIAHTMPHVPIYASADFVGTSKRGLYGDVVQELDWSVGQILQQLADENLLENTLVVFSSDNGPWLVMKHLGGSAGILREGKQFTFEGGMRVPTVAMWKGKIPPESLYTGMVSQMDWFPTFAKLAGYSLPDSLTLDGLDISNVLLKNEERQKDTYLFFDEVGLQGFRSGPWKVKKPYQGTTGSKWMSAVAAHDTLLIDLSIDPGETNNKYPSEKEQALALFKMMEEEYRKLGALPDPIQTQLSPDHRFFEMLNTD